MEEQFVPYEIALKLKEKGFDEECLAYWVDKDTLRSCGAILFEVDGFFKNSLSPEKYLIATPLWQQVIDWLKSKGILITELWDGWEYAKLEEDFTWVQTKEQAIEHALTLI